MQVTIDLQPNISSFTLSFMLETLFYWQFCSENCKQTMTSDSDAFGIDYMKS